MHGNLDPEENVLPDVDEHKDLPKVKLSFDGCYNYSRLKKEGLLDDNEVDCET
jgi:hypothetical protein